MSPCKGRGHFEFSVDRAVACALEPDVRSATVYRSPTLRVTATRRFRRLSGKSVDLVLTIGKPNYAQRKFVAQCQRAKVRFPIEKPQLRFWKRK